MKVHNKENGHITFLFWSEGCMVDMIIPINLVFVYFLALPSLQFQGFLILVIIISSLTITHSTHQVAQYIYVYYKGTLPGKIQQNSSKVQAPERADHIQVLPAQWKMSIVNSGCPESLKESSKMVSRLNSLPLRHKNRVQVMGQKSESKIEMDSKAKEKKIDDLVTLAEKVHGMLILL